LLARHFWLAVDRAGSRPNDLTKAAFEDREAGLRSATIDADAICVSPRRRAAIANAFGMALA